MAASFYFRTVILGATLCGSQYTSVATLYAGLFTAVSSTTDAHTEPADAAYARQRIPMQAPGDGQDLNANEVAFPLATTPWGTIGWVGIYDSVSSGNLLYIGEVSTLRYIGTGSRFALRNNDVRHICT
jgi:hypothetical protein